MKKTTGRKKGKIERERGREEKKEWGRKEVGDLWKNIFNSVWVFQGVSSWSHTFAMGPMLKVDNRGKNPLKALFQ